MIEGVIQVIVGEHPPHPYYHDTCYTPRKGEVFSRLLQHPDIARLRCAACKKPLQQLRLFA